MKKNDLLSICIQNLLRRKARSILTILGVVVGCCSILIMVSIGEGMKESQEKLLSEMGDLTIITVYPDGGQVDSKLNDQAVKDMQRLSGVEVASPKITMQNVSLFLYAGNNQRYQLSYPEVVGLFPEAIEKLGYHLEEGEYLSGQKAYSVLIGKSFEYAFIDSKRSDLNNMIYPYPEVEGGEIPEPFFDAEHTSIELVLGDVEEQGIKQYSQKITTVGRLSEDFSKGYETSQGIIMNAEELLKLQDEYYKLNGIKKPKDTEYSTVMVKVSSIDEVEAVEEQIKEMGFYTSSMESIRKPMQEEARRQQMMLGGLGAISLLVAAIGITNTMIMSISERIKEIGIMKALGCYVHDIKTMFLMESACIGLTGGVIAIILSLLISMGMNLMALKGQYQSFTEAVVLLFTPGSRISVMPPYLLVFSLVFSVLIGLASGYYPASKAVKISVLEAIKSE